ncbi:MAG TPA: hypothetical protein VID27_02670, partial [Blastocatellia bacterium]
MNKSGKNTLCAVMLIGLISLCGSDQASASDDKLKGIVDKYLAARQATMLQTSTETDVDVILAFYTEGIIYEHPRVKMR